MNFKTSQFGELLQRGKYYNEFILSNKKQEFIFFEEHFVFFLKG